VRSGNGKVLTARARRGFPVHRIGTGGVPATGAVFLAVHTVAVLTDAQDKTGLDQHPRIGFEIVLHAHAAKLRSLGEDLAAGASSDSGR